MGLFWDLIQQGQIQASHDHAGTLERRVERLEHELKRTNGMLIRLLQILEQRLGDDLDGDGRVG